MPTARRSATLNRNFNQFDFAIRQEARGPEQRSSRESFPLGLLFIVVICKYTLAMWNNSDDGT
jgi:hypothetical protein